MNADDGHVHHTCCSCQAVITDPLTCPNAGINVCRRRRTPGEALTLEPRPHLTHQLGTAVPSSVITTRPPNGEMPAHRTAPTGPEPVTTTHSDHQSPSTYRL